MHYTALVVVPPDTNMADEKAVKAAVGAVMAPFDENLTVAPWKDYLTAEDVASLCEYHKIDPSDTAAVDAALRSGWDSDEGGRDEVGCYNLRTSNPCGMWDWYEIGGRWSGMFRDVWHAGATALDGNAIRLRDVPPFTPVGWYSIPEADRDEATYIATHDMVLLDKGGPCRLARTGHYDTATRSFPEDPRYAERVATICARYPDHWGILVDYHS